MDSKILRNTAANRTEQHVGQSRIVTFDLHMTRKHHQPRFHRPDMQIMDVLDPWNGFDHSGHLRSADAGRRGLKQDLK